MPFDRAAGILLHPTALPSRGGIGDLGSAAHEFIEFLSRAKQHLWQVLPLGSLGYGNSPYSGISAFAGNELLISLERLAERGWLAPSEIARLPEKVERVDYDAVRAAKTPLLQKAAEKFLETAQGPQRDRFERFCSDNNWWLEDFVLFAALRERHGGATWNTWSRELAAREPAAIGKAREEMKHDLQVLRIIQFFFFEQWRAVRMSSNSRGIKIVGDIAIFVSYDSADVWTHPDLYYLNPDLSPTYVSGVPPDAFSETGQRWGNPLYRWDAIRNGGYDWWVKRMRQALTLCDIIRIDHFRGFEAYWEIPASEPTAVNGRWVKGPGDDLFHALRAALGELPFIAEDLGMITAEVIALRDRLRVPGMNVLQFGFGDKGAHVYLPHRHQRNSVVYTGTHDNDTMRGWWANDASDEEKAAVRAYLGNVDGDVAWAFIRAANDSVADLCIVPMQDVLGLGSDARMNFPSKLDGNWGWRYQPGSLTPELAQRLAALSATADRDEITSATDQQRNREAGEDFAA
jgi:4-alpha-glucanotransferase